MIVRIPMHLRAYIPRAEVAATGKTLGEVLDDLERRHPGFRFRIIDEQDAIREHIKIFVNSEQVWNLSHPVRESDTLQIVAALSGG